MTEYGYYSKSDRNKEIISSVRASDNIQATIMFASRKSLTTQQFDELYEVIEK